MFAIRSAMPLEFSTLAEAAAWFDAWLLEAALPLWSQAGLDAAGGSFQEALTVAGAPWPAPRRSRVQTRQIWVYATAAAAGLGEPYGALAARAYRAYREHYRRPDGLFLYAADADGRSVDETAALYEQAFALLAMAALDARGAGLAADADALAAAAAAAFRHDRGGFRETGARPFQANAQMHLFEAALAWEEAGRGQGSWIGLADELARLALTRFIDARTGALREFFDADWRALADEEGGLIEPGHQFEWAWLLERWGRARGRPEAQAAARRLYAVGLRGVDPAAGVAVNALWSDLSLRDPATRIWAQTEYLKAALLFEDAAEALRAANGLGLYLQTPRRGTWRDKLRADRSFVEEPAPATSFYHLLGAILPLRAAL
jgi:mannose-6-phosphate isomerase